MTLKTSPDEALARSLYQQWRDLRTATAMHPLSCICGSCDKRRSIGGRIVLPYYGAPEKFQLKKE